MDCSPSSPIHDKKMDKVVIFARVSTDRQEYQRQLVELREYCAKAGWQVVREFASKISGAKRNDERPEIMEMIDYIKANAIDRVVVLEISRLGRNTLEALKVIQNLNDNGVSLYIKNYNLETLTSSGQVNPVASLICTILIEIAQMERLTIRERMASGRNQYIRRCREQGIKMGRPSTYRKSVWQGTDPVEEGDKPSECVVTHWNLGQHPAQDSESFLRSCTMIGFGFQNRLHIFASDRSVVPVAFHGKNK